MHTPVRELFVCLYIRQNKQTANPELKYLIFEILESTTCSACEVASHGSNWAPLMLPVLWSDLRWAWAVLTDVTSFCPLSVLLTSRPRPRRSWPTHATRRTWQRDFVSHLSVPQNTPSKGEIRLQSRHDHFNRELFAQRKKPLSLLLLALLRLPAADITRYRSKYKLQVVDNVIACVCIFQPISES